MSTARELLKRSLNYLTLVPKHESYNKLCNDIEDYLSKPEQDPVAIAYEKNGKLYGLSNIYSNHESYIGYKLINLYAEPPTRKPLSDEEIFTIWREQHGQGSQAFARAIEAELNKRG